MNVVKDETLKRGVSAVQTECSAGQLEFQGLGSRRVIAEFTAQQTTSDGGLPLLRLAAALWSPVDQSPKSACVTTWILGPKPPKPPNNTDTFASQLISWGVTLGYVSKQLGLADAAVTARHYARWTEGDEYRAPEALLEGEHPTDLLTRIVWHQSGITADVAQGGSPPPG